MCSQQNVQRQQRVNKKEGRRKREMKEVEGEREVWSISFSLALSTQLHVGEPQLAALWDGEALVLGRVLGKFKLLVIVEDMGPVVLGVSNHVVTQLDGDVVLCLVGQSKREDTGGLVECLLSLRSDVGNSVSAVGSVGAFVLVFLEKKIVNAEITIFKISTKLTCEPVPEGKEGAVAALVVGVVELVPLWATLQLIENLPRGPGKAVATVGVDGLSGPQRHPDTEGEEVNLQHERPAEKGEEDSSNGLHGVRVLRGDANVDLELVVLLVNKLVDEAVVKQAVGPVEEEVLREHAQGDLPNNGEQAGHLLAHVNQVKVLQHRVHEVVNQHEVHNEVIDGNFNHSLKEKEWNQSRIRNKN